LIKIEEDAAEEANYEDDDDFERLSGSEHVELDIMNEVIK